MARTNVRFDPHVHTEASYDATGTVDAVLESASRAGLDAVAITDHDTTVAARAAIEHAPAYDLTVVPGVEISTRDGHVLALGVVDRPPVGASFQTTVSRIREAGGLAVVPHPFQRSRHGVPKRKLADCDGIEVFNPWAMTGIQNRRAARYARRRSYAHLGGSDAHEPSDVGRAHTAVTVSDVAGGGPVSASALLDAVGGGGTMAVGQRTPARRYLAKYSRALGRQVLRRVPQV